ncbi:MAG TPA: selenium metabolism-associated LysR family transcriptional regulator [Bacillota bacterium]
MHFDRLLMFKRVVETRSFSAAAKELGVSQPAVSQAIKALESELGATLIERSPRSVHPTPAGFELYAAATEILERWSRLQTAIWQAVKEPQGPLVIGASNIPAGYILPPLVSRFHRAYPRVELTLRMAGSAEVARWLVERQVDVACTGAAVREEAVACFPFERDELCLIGPPDDGLMDDFDVVHLRELPFIVREEGSGTRQAALACLERHGLGEEQLQIAAIMGSNEAVVAAVAAGMGVAFVSQWAARTAEAAGRVRRLPFHCPHLERLVYCAYRTDRALNPAAARWIQLLREHAERQGLGPAAELATG